MNTMMRVLALATVTAGLLFLPALDATARPGGKGMGPGAGMGPNGPGGPGLMGLADLSDKQMESILELEKDMKLEQMKIDRERAELRDECQQLADDPDANRARLGTIHKRMEELQLNSRKLHVKHQEQMMKVLTDEQWEELGMQRAERRTARQERWQDRPGGGPGQGFGPRANCPGYGYGPGMGQGMGPGPRGMGFGHQGPRGNGPGACWWH